MKKKPALDTPEEILGGGSTLLLGADTEEICDRQEARQRDQEPDEFDLGTDVSDDRVRGAGDQSMEDLIFQSEKSSGLEEHSGGIRFDQPDSNTNNQI